MKKQSAVTRGLIMTSASLMAIVGALSLAGAAQAQDAAAGAPAANDDTVIVVTGFRKSYADAVKTKRDSIEITDSISSDGLGRFPDLNVGEAIQRIPGVQLNREADSRNATISLRGLPGSFARTTLNGIAFADPILDTATNTASTPLGAFNSDIFSSITVIKSPSAANLAGGLSGNIDLRIAPALSRKEGNFIKVSNEYNTLGKLSSPLVSFGFNKRLSHDFAIFGTIAAKDEKFRRDSISINSWSDKLGSIQVGNQAVPGSNPVYDALIAQYPGGVYFPQQVRQFVRYNRGHLLSAATGFEWQATENLKIGTTAFYTERNLDEGTNDLLYMDTAEGKNTNTALTATSAVTHFTSLGTPFVVNTPSGPKAYINEFTAENVKTYDSVRSEPAKQMTWAVNPTIEFKNEAWRLTGTATVSRATVLANQIELDVIQFPYKNLTAQNGITTSLNVGGTDLSNINLVVNTPNASHISPNGYSVPSAPNQATQAQNALGDRFGVTGTNGQANNFLNAVQADAERFFAGDHFFTSVQFGVRLERDKYVSTGSRNVSLGALTGDIRPSLAHELPYAADFFGGQAPGYSQNWLTLNPAETLAILTPINQGLRSGTNPGGLPAQFKMDPATGVFLTPYGLVNNYWDLNYYRNNFTNASDVNSAYFMAKFKLDVFNIPVRGNLGVRYEDTQNTVTTLTCVNCTANLSKVNGAVNHSLRTDTYKQDYHYALPSLILAADLTDKLILRFAAYSTYVRPQPRDNYPSTSLNSPEPTDAAGTYYTSPTYTVALGSSSLKPYTADSLDMSLEWYNRPGGLFALAIYQKKISGFIGAITDPAILCPADGRINGEDFGLGSLSIVGTTCQSTNAFPTNAAGTTSAPAIVKISGNANLQPMTVNGVELNIQQNLDFLPGFWKNFGGAFNYAHTTVSGTDQNGKPITLPNVSKDNVNLIGYYETKKFGLRLVYNYRGKYDLAAGNSFVGDARTVNARSQLDASASYNITKAISISLDGFNLTDATRSEYENDPLLPRRIDYDGRTYQVTLRASF